MRVDVATVVGQPYASELRADELDVLIRPIREALDVYDLGADPDIQARSARCAWPCATGNSRRRPARSPASSRRPRLLRIARHQRGMADARLVVPDRVRRRHEARFPGPGAAVAGPSGLGRSARLQRRAGGVYQYLRALTPCVRASTALVSGSSPRGCPRSGRRRSLCSGWSPGSCISGPPCWPAAPTTRGMRCRTCRRRSPGVRPRRTRPIRGGGGGPPATWSFRRTGRQRDPCRPYLYVLVPPGTDAIWPDALASAGADCLGGTSPYVRHVGVPRVDRTAPSGTYWVTTPEPAARLHADPEHPQRVLHARSARPRTWTGSGRPHSPLHVRPAPSIVRFDHPTRHGTLPDTTDTGTAPRRPGRLG
jgi:hypothetical protein